MKKNGEIPRRKWISKNQKKKKKRRGPYTSESQAVLKMVRQSGTDESDNQA